MRKKPEVSLRTRALQYLARREYSRAELRGKLLPHARAACQPEQCEPPDDGSFEQLAPPRSLHDCDELCDPEAALAELDALLDDLSSRGWLSDQRAAAQLLHARRARFGVQRITHELRQKGISDELIAQALPELRGSELATAREVWQRKFGVLPQDVKEKARQMRFLQSRGFGLDIILKVLRHDASDE
ncbi:MAG: regulatory protein RecX [Gallionella sp.]|nr:regulatory protein RecX [Gallionella sp.]MDD4947163.1 regulatory protein RecX [Gallionella sp.]MDD5613224.1 regulatory protein RecX [Gallionella sp.]